MRKSAVLASKYYELSPLLRRGFWQPLHRTMQIFHVLPLTVALIVFFLLATSGQLREIYLSYLENLSGPGPHQIASTATAFAAAAAGLALLSAALYAAHYELSSMRIDLVYSARSNPEAGSRLRTLQRAAAFNLALLPWLGLVAGLFGARNYLTERYDLLNVAVDAPALASMLHLPKPGAWAIAVSAIAAGLATAFIQDFYRQNRVVQWIAIVATPVAAASLFLLLTNSSPGTESKAGTAGTFAGVALLAVGYCVVHIRLYSQRAKFIYSYALHSGINLRQRRRIFLFIWALFPWLAVAIYFAIAPHFGNDIATPGSPSWAMIPLAMTWTISTGLFVAMLLDRFRENATLNWAIVISIVMLIIAAQVASWLGVDAIVSLYRWVGPLGSIALEILFVLSAFTLLAWLSQKSGFPALTLVVLAIVISAIFPVPIKVTFYALTIVCAFFVIMALLSHLTVVAILAAILVLPGAINVLEESNSPPATPYTKTDPALCRRFETWLGQRGGAPKTSVATDQCARVGAIAAPTSNDAAPNQGQYPVFIIAVEGGGIYAATAAALFLARLQDRVPDFSQHVFAISGVSGGAIGAAIFQALDRSALKDKPAAGPPTQTCGRAESASRLSSPPAALSESQDRSQRRPASDQPAMQRSLTQEVSKIMQDDHLSPVVASIFPELFGASTRRAQAQTASFEESVRSQDSDAAQELCGAFVDHWSENSQAPALVLNTTWVETGFRVAFAPFPLHENGDQSLYSFSDKNMPGEDSVSLMDAAVDSARFPGILPPYTVTMRENSAGRSRELLWNFVDGGYSDNSGASTALALYRVLEPIAQQRNAAIKLILLTSSYSQPDLSPADVNVTGTAFRDTLAPIDAVMKVREGLSNEAVVRVCDFFYHGEKCKDRAAAARAPLQIVEIDNQTYGLPLGWKLSQMSFDVVSWMLGRPELCAPPPTAAAAPAQPTQAKAPSTGRSSFELILRQFGLAQDSAPPSNERSRDTVRSNSCVLSHVEDLLKENQLNGREGALRSPPLP